MAKKKPKKVLGKKTLKKTKGGLQEGPLARPSVKLPPLGGGIRLPGADKFLKID